MLKNNQIFLQTYPNYKALGILLKTRYQMEIK